MEINNNLPIDFDWKIYLSLNEDVAKNRRFNTEEGSIEHWIKYGCKERRKYKIDTIDIIDTKHIKVKSKNNKNNFMCLNVRADNNIFIPIQKMLESRYTKLNEYTDYLVVLGYNIGYENNFNISNLRVKYPNKKIVIYQLEQLYNFGSQWYNPKSENRTVLIRTEYIKKILSECDEIWDYDLDNIEFLKKEGYKNIKHVPVFYCEELKRKNVINVFEYDLLFYGSLNERRVEYLNMLVDKYKLCIIVPQSDISKYKNTPIGKYLIKPKYDADLFNIINKTKIILNIHYYETFLQEQVRIFELLINNKIVLSEKSRRNYFGDMIHEFNDKTDFISKIEHLLRVYDSKWDDVNISEQYKNNDNYKIKNKKIKIGAVYNTFYGLEQIEKSILSIKPIVDYIIIVHQKVSFSGQEEPNVNKYIIDYLLNNGLVNDVYYYDSYKKTERNGVLEKRNIGLEYCKKNNCEYILAMDADELYDSKELYNEIKFMDDNGIETLYSPIHSYYGDEKHYFVDTYYVTSVLKINDRKFIITKSSVLVDPVRKMEERKFKISNVPMLHHTYFIEQYINKTKYFKHPNESIRKNQFNILYDLINWDGSNLNVNVFANDMNNGGEVIIQNIELKKIK